MTAEERLAALKAMVGDSDSDDVLTAYLTLAGSKILARAYPYDDTQTVVPTRYEYLLIEIAAYMLNKRGGEGEISHSENGVSRAWEKGDIPLSMLSTITPFVGTFGASMEVPP